MSVNLKNLDFKTAGFWPAPFKLAAYAVTFLGILVLAWLLFFSSETNKLRSLAAKEVELRDEFQRVQAKANSLGALKEQLKQIDILLKSMVQQLPSKNEIPDLVINVSQAALGNGLAIDLFQPQEEVKQDFYAEKRIDVKMRGNYHQLGKFFSDVATQPRLVAVVVDGMSVERVAPEKEKSSKADPSQGPGVTSIDGKPVDGNLLDFSGSVRTYRYLSEDEEAEIASAKAEAEKKKKKKKPAAKPGAKKPDEKAAE